MDRRRPDVANELGHVLGTMTASYQDRQLSVLDNACYVN
jgi:hypothetical protein